MASARRSLIVLCVVAGCASVAPQPGLHITTRVPGGGAEQIPATLSKPDGPGPFAAVVLLRDCSAPGAGLVERGYVVLCIGAPPRRAELRRTYDARAAAAYLRTLPYVDGRRIGLMGGSHGGTTTLNTMLLGGFAAAVALDPRCAPRGIYRPTAPVLILIGEKDDWTPAGACRRLAADAQAARQPVSIRIYSKGEAAAFFAAHLKQKFRG